MGHGSNDKRTRRVDGPDSEAPYQESHEEQYRRPPDTAQVAQYQYVVAKDEKLLDCCQRHCVSTEDVPKMLREADSGTSRQCSLEDGREKDGYRRSLGLREIARVGKLAVQIPEQKVMP
jgi:hypothetical protein